MAFLPDGSLLVTEKAGQPQAARTRRGMIRDIAGVPTVQQEQGGLLDVAIAPDFATSTTHLSHLFASRARAAQQPALARATLDGTQLEKLQVIWRAGSDGEGGQFGANIAFAPDGKSLFLSSGERQRFTPAQDPTRSSARSCT